jgi:hypothetical protein
VNGIEFKAIRVFNRISQTKLANAIGIRSRRSITDLEYLDEVPDRYINILGKIIGLNLLDPTIAKVTYEKAFTALMKKYRSREFSLSYLEQTQRPRIPWKPTGFSLY